MNCRPFPLAVRGILRDSNGAERGTPPLLERFLKYDSDVQSGEQPAARRPEARCTPVSVGGCGVACAGERRRRESTGPVRPRIGMSRLRGQRGVVGWNSQRYAAEDFYTRQVPATQCRTAGAVTDLSKSRRLGYRWPVSIRRQSQLSLIAPTLDIYHPAGTASDSVRPHSNRCATCG